MSGVLQKLKDFIIKGNFLVSKSEEHQAQCAEMSRNIQELLWRDIFADTVKGYAWYNGKSLSLGRWAIGYNYAYVLVRVLEEFKPKRILECGLGQSSKIIADYIASEDGAVYDIVEQDPNWVDFFKQNCRFGERVQIHIRDIIESNVSIQGTKSYIYKDFDSVVKGKKYALLSIDGPWGSELYSRIDILDHIPSILQDDFVIMVDDFERIGERNMVNLLKERLNQNILLMPRENILVQKISV